MATITNHSTNPSFETGSGTIEVLRNYIANPSFEDGDGGRWFVNDLTHYSTSFPDEGVKGIKCFRMARAGAFTTDNNGLYTTLDATIVSGDKYTSSVFVRPSIEIQIRFGLQTANEEILPTTCPAGVWTRVSTTQTAVNSGIFILYLAPSQTITDGLVVDFDGVSCTKTSFLAPYFDGAMTDLDPLSLTPSWTGTANVSASILTGVRVPNTYAWQAGGGVKIWLSQDNPSQGNSFARYMTTAPTSDLWANIIDTSGVSIGDEITSGLNCRISGALSYACGSNSSVGDAFIVRTAPQTSTEDWEQARFTYSSVRENGGVGVRVDSAPPGTIVDIDDHFVVKGTYNSAYFDGSTPGASWTGTANASTSTIDTPFLTLWDGTEEKFVSGVEVI